MGFRVTSACKKQTKKGCGDQNTQVETYTRMTPATVMSYLLPKSLQPPPSQMVLTNSLPTLSPGTHQTQGAHCEQAKLGRLLVIHVEATLSQFLSVEL